MLKVKQLSQLLYILVKHYQGKIILATSILQITTSDDLRFSSLIDIIYVDVPGLAVILQSIKLHLRILLVKRGYFNVNACAHSVYLYLTTVNFFSTVQ